MKQAMIAETAGTAASTAVCRWDEIRFARVLSEQNSHFQGLTINEISRLWSTGSETTVMDLVLEERCQATRHRIFQQIDDLTMAVTHPLTMIETDAMGLVEGNPSIGQYGSFPRVLGYYVREKKLLRLEEAVRKMTSLDVLRDPEFRAALKAEARTATVPNRFSYHSFETLTVMETTCDKHSVYVGRRLADMAREQGKDPFD